MKNLLPPAILLLTVCIGCKAPLSDEAALLAVRMKVFDHAEDVPAPYKVLGEIKGRSRPKGASIFSLGPDSALTSAKEEAARIGANGLIVESIKNIGWTASTVDTYECKGLAIRYEAK